MSRVIPTAGPGSGARRSHHPLSIVDLAAVIALWPRDAEGWSLAPAGLEWITPGSRLKSGADVTVRPQVRVGDRVVFGELVKVARNCTIGSGVTIGNQAVIGQYCELEDGCRIGDGVVLQDGVHVGREQVFGGTVSAIGGQVDGLQPAAAERDMTFRPAKAPRQPSDDASTNEGEAQRVS